MNATDTLLLHIAKSGGGTVRKEIEENGVLVQKVCHPRPCRNILSNFNRTLVTIRDPVDRFVSAFNWRSLVLCHAVNETRTPNLKATLYPDSFCNPHSPKESIMLHAKYKSNANHLAEAVCDTGSAGEEARQDLKMIKMMKETLVDWLPADSWMSTRLFAIVQEPGFDFMEQVNAAMEWLVLETNFTIRENQTIPIQFQHSTKFHGKDPQLSPLGTCCMARHLARDYDLLDNLTSVACRGGRSDICKAALSSILDRRKAILEGNSSCHDIALSMMPLPASKNVDSGARVPRPQRFFHPQTPHIAFWLLVQAMAVCLVLTIYKKHNRHRLLNLESDNRNEDI